MTQEEAQRSARIELGGAEQVKERVRSVRTAAWLETLLQDIRFGLRMLCKSPVFTSIAILTVALGVGATTAVYNLLSAVVCHSLSIPLPVASFVLRCMPTPNAL